MQSLAIGYDKADRIAAMTNGIDPSQSESYNYDDQSRLTAAYGVANNESYGYDADGNRVAQTVNGATATFGISATSNRLMSVSGAVSQTYGYDPQGNLQTVDGATAFQYNPFNRLASASGANDYVDPQGQRLRKTSSAGTTYFASEGASLLAESVNGTWIDYVWLNGRLIGRASGSAVYAVHDDQTGRPQMVTDASGAVAWKANNYPFDRMVVVDNIGGLNVGFPGQYYDSERGIWSNGYRDYNASLGRYIESDPLGISAGVNTYAYAFNNPLSFHDPFGLAPGDCYASQDIAAANAIADINPTSISKGVEYGGWLYRTPNGWYSYTAPHIGTWSSVERWSPMPSGVTGFYHTHGSYLQPSDENFSSDDLANTIFGQTDYVGTPLGEIKSWDKFHIRNVSTRAEPGDSQPCGCEEQNSLLNQIWSNITR